MEKDDYAERTRRAHAKLRMAMAVIAGVMVAVPMLAGGHGKGASTAQAKVQAKPAVSVIIR